MDFFITCNKCKLQHVVETCQNPNKKFNWHNWHNYELQAVFPYGLNYRIGDEFKTDNRHINVAIKFSFLQRKYSCANGSKNHKSFTCLLPEQFLKDLNHMLNTSIKDGPKFIRISIYIMKKSYLKVTPKAQFL